MVEDIKKSCYIQISPSSQEINVFDPSLTFLRTEKWCIVNMNNCLPGLARSFASFILYWARLSTSLSICFYTLHRNKITPLALYCIEGVVFSHHHAQHVLSEEWLPALCICGNYIHSW